MKTWKIVSLVLAIMLLAALPAMAAQVDGVPTESEHSCDPETRNVVQQVIKEPTCTATGTMKYTCTGVHRTYNPDGSIATETPCKYCTYGDIARTDHNWDQGTVTTPGGCLTDGVITYKCQNQLCNATKTEKIPAIGWHELDVTDAGWTVVAAPTCEQHGLRTQKCRKCGEIISDTGSNQPAWLLQYDSFNRDAMKALGHDWVELPGSRKAATCTTPETIDIRCARPNCQKQVNGAYVTKDANGNTIYKRNGQPAAAGEALGHNWSDWSIINPDDCTGAGDQIHYCTFCNASEIKVNPAKGHIFDNDAAENTATCEKAGTLSGYCLRCGRYIKNYATSPNKGGHWYPSTVATDPVKNGVPSTQKVANIRWNTDTEHNKKYAVCVVCGNVLSQSSVAGKTSVAQDAGSGTTTGLTAVKPDKTASQAKDPLGNVTIKPTTTNPTYAGGASAFTKRAPTTADQIAADHLNKTGNAAKLNTTGTAATTGAAGTTGTAAKGTTNAAGVTIAKTGEASITWAYVLMAASLVALVAVNAKRRALQK